MKISYKSFKIIILFFIALIFSLSAFIYPRMLSVVVSASDTAVVTINNIPDYINALPTISGTSIDTTPSTIDRVQVQIVNQTNNTCWDGNAWQLPTVSIQTPDWFQVVGDYTSLAFDFNGNPAISYYRETLGGQGLRLARWNGSGWVVQIVDSSGNVGMYTSLAFVWDGSYGYTKPAISYYDGTNQDLKYARWDGSSWIIQTVDSAGDVGYYTSLAFDGSGNPAISYYDYTNQDLKFARWDGSIWNVQIVDSNGDVGEYSSLCFQYNFPCISYYDGTNQDLKYARWGGSWWDKQTIDSTGNVGEYTSLAIDFANNPGVSYYDGTNQDLKYARWDGASSSWVLSGIVDSIGDVGRHTSLAFDLYGKPAISYFDSTNFDLKIARWNGSNWLLSTVDFSGSVGLYNSLALDSNGSPAISYTDGTNRDLKFARLTYSWVDVQGKESWSYVMPILSDGSSYEITARIIDGNGNLLSRVREHFVYDTAAPVISNIVVSNTTVKSVTIAWTTNDASTSQVEYGTSTSYGLASTLDSTAVTSHYVNITGLTSGTVYHYRVKSKDISNNQGISVDGTFVTLKLTLNNTPDYVNSLLTIGGTSTDSTPGTISKVQVQINNQTTDTCWNGTTWQTPSITIQTIDDFQFTGLYASLAYDSSGHPAISYSKQTAGSGTKGLKFALWDGSQWVVGGGGFGTYNVYYTSLAFDEKDKLYVSYYENGTLKLALWNGLYWSGQTVDSTGDVGGYTSLAFDISGNPSISYYDVTNQDLKMARWNGSSWNIHIVDSIGNVGMYTSLAFDASGNPAISYQDVTNQDLKMARWNGSSWVLQTIDSTGDVGEYTSLVFDRSGNPSISYYDVTNQDLKMARWNGSSWNIHIVDSIGNVGMYTSLDLDGSGNPAISYYDVTNQDLKFARWNGSCWSMRKIDKAGDSYTSLAFDTSGNPTISYFDGINADLKFAIINNSWLDAEGKASWSYNLPVLDNGNSYKIAVKMIDFQGNLLASYQKHFIYDTTAPLILDITISEITDTSATISWITNEISNSQVEYGTSISYGKASDLDARLLVSHSIIITGLSPGTTYHYRIKSQDCANNEGLSIDGNFSTAADITPGSKCCCGSTKDGDLVLIGGILIGIILFRKFGLIN